MTTTANKTWTIVTDVAALWGVAEGDDRDGALEDAREWCEEFNTAAADVRVCVYRVAGEEEDADLSARFCAGFSLPEELETALAGSPGLVRVGGAK